MQNTAITSCTRDFQDRSENPVDRAEILRHNGDLPDEAIRSVCLFLELLDRELPEFAKMSDDTVCELQMAVERAMLAAIYSARGARGRGRKKKRESGEAYLPADEEGGRGRR